jgi:hypothetical protein
MTIGTTIASKACSEGMPRAMPPKNRTALCATLILMSATGGCSFAFVSGPPPNHKQLNFFGCTSSNTVPTLDLVGGALFLIDGVAAATGGSASGSGSTATGSTKGDVITFAAGAALLGASAAYGYKKTAECRDAEADLVRRTPPTPTLAPVRYLPPPVPYDPWLPHPAVVPVAPTPPAPAPAAPPPGRSSAWDPENPAQ